MFVFMALKRVVQMVLKRTILILKWSLFNVQFCKTIPENVHTPLTEGIGSSWGGGWGFFKTQKFKKCVKFYWNFQRGRGKGRRKTPFCGGGMDIFWSYTLSPHMAH